ncbi:zinc-dependent alcohol dehydrogenase [Paraburkholderia bannensis]|uniref:zinc-dependent alcohol dehydrogenase n=1 Tax=Paraburkholderia bannensis TaxID=765414 RepID=UPI002AB19C87|nr:alcohol dehydrogenase catalytic domain-containing protein [Paraburkholderia bannensis]
MTKKVWAAVKTAAETTELRQFDYPELKSDTGILRVEASGVGGSDPEVYRKPDHAPLIMGHENVGTLEAVGPVAARRWGMKAGDRVALHEYLPCWHCEWCMKGDFRLCMEVDFFNVKDRLNTLRFGMSTCEIAPHLWGGYAQYMHLPLNTVMHRIPDDMPATHATLAVPFGNGVQWACNDGGAGPGKTVLVFGPGQQGLGCVLAAKAAGSLTVILAGMTRDRSRLDLSLRMGADHAIDVQDLNLEAEVMRVTNGRGVDVVVDTTGDPDGSVAAQAIALAAKGAWLSLNGLHQQVPIGEIKKRYLTVRAPRGRSYAAVELALRYIASGRYPLDEVCSHTFGLAQTHEAILATAGRGVEGAIHVCVDPWR